MKQFLIGALLALSTLFCSAQNGGLVNENSVIKIDYVNYNFQTSNFVFLITNKQNCSVTAQYKIVHTNQIVDITLSGNGTYTVYVPGVITEDEHVKAKATSFCPGVVVNSGWVETDNQGGTILPIKFKSISTQRINADSIRITFESEEDNTIEYYVAKISFDGKIWKEVAIVMPNGIVGNKTYSVTVKIKP